MVVHVLELATVLAYKIGAISVNADGCHICQQIWELLVNHAQHMSCKDLRALLWQVMIFSICPSILTQGTPATT